MAFTDEALKAKLSTLNETQDSIVSVSQWIMFHRRHADRIVSFWLQRLRDSNSAKQLNLLYLVNEIVQNSRARRKDDFPNAFSPIMAEAAQTAYRSTTTEIQQKIRRLVEVWRARRVFETPIQDAIEVRLDDVDKTRPAGKKQLMGGSIFGSAGGSGGLPNGLETLASPQLAVSKASLSTTSTLNTANAEYDKLNDPNVQLPAPPLYAARLSALLKSLATAESSVSESISARKSLISELEKILQTHHKSLGNDETSLQELQNRKAAMENKRREVEDGIRRTAAAADDVGLYASSNNNHNSDNARDRSDSYPPIAVDREMDMDRPEYEALTPPPVEALTPVGSPPPQQSGPVQEADPAPAPDPSSLINTSVHDLLASMSSVPFPPTSAPPESAQPLSPLPSNHISSVGAGVGTNGFDPTITSIHITTHNSKKRKREITHSNQHRHQHQHQSTEAGASPTPSDSEST